VRSELILQANGVSLCAETFGDRADPGILLIMGSGAPMDWWEDEFCERLAAGARYVIRYDHRDTGRSVSYEPGSPHYTLGDLAADALGLLDALGIAEAHLAGMSMGGAIAQLVALDHPARVASLILISTSFADRDISHLPTMSKDDAARFRAPEPDWSDRDAVLDHIVHLARAGASRSRPFDEEAVRALAGRVFDRSADMEATLTNHDLIVGRGDDPPGRGLAELDVPVLVIHGTEDPVLPFAHAEALASAIPDAELLALAQTGHELPRETWGEVVPAILAHTSR
jgi:pimeloyl-ACP methyl ester carboxylesterase